MGPQLKLQEKMTNCYKHSVQCLIYIRDILLARILLKTQEFTNEKMKIIDIKLL